MTAIREEIARKLTQQGRLLPEKIFLPLAILLVVVFCLASTVASADPVQGE